MAVIEELRSRFTEAMRKVPGAVAIIAASHQGARGGLTATAWTAVTADPPTLLACVNQRASAFGVVHGAEAFSINLLAFDDAETAAVFSSQRGLDGEGRFVEGAWAIGASGAPVLRTAVVSFECSTTARVVQGSHVIFIGKITTAAPQGCKAALLYHDRQFAVARKLDVRGRD